MKHDRGRLRPTASAGIIVGGFLAGLEHAIGNRPPAVAQIEEELGRAGLERHGFVIDGLDDPIERPEPPDRSGARL